MELFDNTSRKRNITLKREKFWIMFQNIPPKNDNEYFKNCMLKLLVDPLQSPRSVKIPEISKNLWVDAVHERWSK